MCSRERSGIDLAQPDQPQQRRHRAGDFLAQHFAVFLPGQTGRLERGQDTDRLPGGRTGRVQGVIDRIAQSQQLLASQPPLRQTLAPALAVSAARAGSRFPFAAGGFRIDPRLEILRPAGSGKCSSRLPRSPLGSIMIAGIPCRAASSNNPMHSPVLPEPVMPVTTACVVRLTGSYSSGWSVVLPVAVIENTSQIKIR